jgi:hypothetical protein
MTDIQLSNPDQDYRQALEAQQAGRYEQAVHLLARAGAQDHVMALSMLGGQLMAGRGIKQDFASGLTLIRRAAELGGAYALAVVAATTAYGLDGRPDWEGALNQLQRAAELGHESAQTQLRILAELEGPKPPVTSWARLRSSIDLDAWLSPPAPETLLEDPQIRIVPGLAPAAACQWLISRVADRLQRAVIYNAFNAKQTPNQARTNTYAAIGLWDADLVAMILQHRLAVAAGLDVLKFESVQVLHYGVGEQYEPHYDFVEPGLPGTVADLAQFGQRTTTLLIYLNEGFEGGETDFPVTGVRYKGKTGDAIMFRNLTPEGAPDRRTRHAGLPPTSGEKWLFSQWVRDRKYR